MDSSEKADENAEVTIDFQKVTSNFDNVLSKFNKAATDIKLGKLNPKILTIWKLTLATMDMKNWSHLHLLQNFCKRKKLYYQLV